MSRLVTSEAIRAAYENIALLECERREKLNKNTANSDWFDARNKNLKVMKETMSILLEIDYWQIDMKVNNVADELESTGQYARFKQIIGMK